MLRSGGASGSMAESTEPCTVEARLQSKLAAAALALEHEITEKMRLHNTVELLQAEIEEYKRNQKVMKSEVKWLTTDIDNLRRSISRYRGILPMIIIVINRHAHTIVLASLMLTTISPLHNLSWTAFVTS